MRRALLILALMAAVVACNPDAPPTPECPWVKPANPALLVVHVLDGKFVDSHCQPLRLTGVNRPGMEYRPVQVPSHPAFISGDDWATSGRDKDYVNTVVSGLLTWPGNVVRLPLNEECWLGINGASTTYCGAPYREFVIRLVLMLGIHGRYVVLDNHWSAHGSILPGFENGAATNGQDVAPNADHSIEFMRQLAAAFLKAPGVMFDIANEPHIWLPKGTYVESRDASWKLYRDGGPYTYDATQDWMPLRDGTAYDIAGTQQLVDAIRSTGSQATILIPGLGTANATDGWMKFRPFDPLDQLAVSFHTYPNSGANVNNMQNLEGRFTDIDGHYPVFVTEFGDWACPMGMAMGPFVQQTLDWMRTKGYSYTGWGADSGEGCNGPTLVTNDALGTPSPYGAIVKADLAKT